MKLIILPLTLLGLAQLNPQPEEPALESIPIQESKAKRNLNLALLGLLGGIGLAGVRDRQPKQPEQYLKTDEENYFG